MSSHDLERAVAGSGLGLFGSAHYRSNHSFSGKWPLPLKPEGLLSQYRATTEKKMEFCHDRAGSAGN